MATLVATKTYDSHADTALGDAMTTFGSDLQDWPGSLGRLSRREREVLGLLADGYTDRGIAAHLTLARRTVETHVRHILIKLDIVPDPSVNPRVRAATVFHTMRSVQRE